jgi:hypothetical protein
MRIDVVIDALWPDLTVEKAARRLQCARSRRPGLFATGLPQAARGGDLPWTSAATNAPPRTAAPAAADPAAHRLGVRIDVAAEQMV